MCLIFEIAAAAVICAAVIVMLHTARGVLVTPVPVDEGSSLFVVIPVSGDAERLEQTVKGLLWLYENGTLDCRIVISDCGLSESGRRIVSMLQSDGENVILCAPDDLAALTEVSEWTKKNSTYK